MTEHFSDSTSQFLDRAFRAFSMPFSEESLEQTLLEENISLCHAFDLSLIQDSWSFRNMHMARRLSFFLIDDSGNLILQQIAKALEILRVGAFSLGPQRYHDDSRKKHLMKILSLFLENKEFEQALKRIHKPHFNLLGEQIIRETLDLPSTVKITSAHARRAALSAMLSKLRQNVGSCFATAPAIMIHEHLPLQLLYDIASLFGTGKLSRILNGKEYSVPLSPSWGMGDLLRPIFLSQQGSDLYAMLAQSPGLQKAFAAVSLLDNDCSLEEKRKGCEAILRQINFSKDSFYLTADAIIQGALLSAYNVEEGEVRSYHERSLAGPFGEMAMSFEGYRQPKNLACSRYLSALALARSSFKSLTDNALLKSWEFTLASFAETKSDFAKWNLYISLGASSEETNGVGKIIIEEMQQELDEINDRLAEIGSHYDHLFSQVKYLEGRFRRASESETGWLRAEYEIRKREIDHIFLQREEALEKGRKLSNFHAFLISYWSEVIPQFYQEIYDADMHDVASSAYDDTPAGFRLLYKHGRSNPALWTPIRSASEYIQYLTAFFAATETELVQKQEAFGIEREISRIMTRLITEVRKPEFLQASLIRLARAYKEPIIGEPLENLEQVARKPWVYVSGGTMQTLVSGYFGREGFPSEVKRWVENPVELLVFFIDSIKELSNSVKRQLCENQDLPMLAFSPTHAFLLKPGWDLFREGWEDGTYTYTWIRDKWINLQLRFLEENILDISVMQALLDEILDMIPAPYREIVRKGMPVFFNPLSPKEFREEVMLNLSYQRIMRAGPLFNRIAEEIDSLLFRYLPFFPSSRLKENIEKIFSELQELSEAAREKIYAAVDLADEAIGRRAVLSAQDLRHVCCALLITAMRQTTFALPFYDRVNRAMQKHQLAYPSPILIGDTNWVKNTFGFVLNPGTEKVEFWRFDEYGSEGRPINEWNVHLNGTSKEAWGFFTDIRQYGLT